MSNILLFAGTTEGRMTAEALRGSSCRLSVCVATEYGKALVEEGENIRVYAGRMSREEMEAFARREAITLILDATHPFATEVTRNIRETAQSCGIRYLRILREEEERSGKAVYTASLTEAVQYLKNRDGNIFITTGSKELLPYQEIPDWEERCYLRVLSTEEAVAAAGKAGFAGSHLIAMQGPFSTEMNTALLRHTKARYLVTKESGEAGGFAEKIEAAHQVGVIPIVIGRPGEEGISVAEALRQVEQGGDVLRSRRIILAGIGPGHMDLMTGEVRSAVAEADVLIGARRMLEPWKDTGRTCHEEYRPEEIKKYIKDHNEFRNIVVLFSGDLSFYSGAKKLMQCLGKEEVVLLPGISSVSLMAARLGESWEDSTIGSLHGQSTGVLAALREKGKVFLLTGKSGDIREVCHRLCRFGKPEAEVAAGSHLSYREERILRGTAEELAENPETEKMDGLSVLFIKDPLWEPQVLTPGFADSFFVRGAVPMTKQEVRTVILSAMKLRKNSVVYDIGAGTGSVAVEAARIACCGTVYAIEQKTEGIALIDTNSGKAGTENVIAVEGKAPDILEKLEAPQIVFIGGSGGNLEQILECVRKKNENVRVVVSAITPQTAADCLRYMEKFPEAASDIVQIQASRGKKVGKSWLMEGQNPVYVITMDFSGEREEKGR